MRTKVLAGLFCWVVGGCGGEAAESEGSTSGSSSGGVTSGTNEAPTTGTVETTTSGEGTTTSESSGGTTTSESSGGASESGSSEGTTESGVVDCRNLLSGQEPVLWASGFTGSEDLGFDGVGGLALKRGGEVVVVAADLSETVLATGVPKAYGTRFLADGRLLVALPQDGKVIAIDGGGAVSDFVTDVATPNGLFPDDKETVWVTEFGGDRVIRVDANMQKTTILTGADATAANGVVFDSERGLLFWTKYQAGEVWQVKIYDENEPGQPVLVTKLAGTYLDGLTMDACGFLYVVNQGGDELYRVLLDAAGVTVAEPELLATFPSNVANAQFGSGPGFDEQTLYVSGNPGDVYTLLVGIPGA